MRFLLRALLVIVVLLALAGGLVFWSMSPPAALDMPERGAALHGVTLINPGLDRQANMTLVVEGERIQAVREAKSVDAKNAPYAGMYALPGLSDMHVHFPPAGLPGQAELFTFLFLYHGVTTVRDAGDVDGTSTEPVRDGVKHGRFPGPRVFACGPFVDGDAPIWGNTRVVTTRAQARQAVVDIHTAGFDCVKAYNGLTAETLEAIRSEARERKLPVIGHVPRGMTYGAARLDDNQHLIALHPTPEPPDATYPDLMEAWARLDDARIRSIVRITLEHDLANTPTLVTSDRLAGVIDHARMAATRDAKLLPPFYPNLVWSPAEGLSNVRTMTPEKAATLRASEAGRLRMVKALHDAGARLHLGTDVQNPFVVPGISLHREMRLFAKSGLTPEQVWAIGTRGPAKILKDELHGRLVRGARADVLVYRDDPTRSLDALDSLQAVIVDGRLYTRAELDAQLARYQKWFNGAVYEAVSYALVRRVLAGIIEE